MSEICALSGFQDLGFVTRTGGWVPAEVREHTGTFPFLEHLLKEGRAPETAARARRGSRHPKVIPDTATTRRFIQLSPPCQPSVPTAQMAFLLGEIQDKATDNTGKDKKHSGFTLWDPPAPGFSPKKTPAVMDDHQSGFQLNTTG